MKKTALAQASAEVMVAETAVARIHARWIDVAHAPPHGRLVFSAEFLAAAGVFGRWADAGPLQYGQPRFARSHYAAGTLMDSVRSTLARRRVMDIDAQQGAEIGDNPHKLRRADSGDART